MADIKIIEVQSKKDRRRFVDFPLWLYRGCEYFVPPLYGDEMLVFTDKNAYADTSESVFFLAERDGKTVYILRDNDSTNGTKVNNEPITEQVLKNSDLITFGHVEVLFDGAGEPDEESHFTHTIDLGSATTNTTTTQTLTNFSARMMDEKKKNAQTNLLMNIIIVAGGIMVVGVVIYTLFFHK